MSIEEGDVMDIKEIKKRVKEIRDSAKDKFNYDVTHDIEDKLYRDFVSFIEKEAPEPFRSMAKEVLKSKKIEYIRAVQ